MLKLATILLLLLAMLLWWRFAAWRSGRALRRQSRILQNDQVDRALDRLAAAAGIDRITVRVLDQQAINGLVTPAGDIYVTRGLFDRFRSGEVTLPEFSSVVAHELGHLALGHTRRRIVDVSTAQIANLVVGGILARFIPYVGWIIARLVSTMLVTSLSRSDEFEADQYATALMIKAGLGAEPQARMLEKLETLQPHRAGATGIAWLASHPPVPERAEAIRGNARRWGGQVSVR